MAKQKRKTRPIKSKKARVQKKQLKRVQDQRRTDLLNAGLSPAIIARGDLVNKELSKKAISDWRTRGQKLDELQKRGYTNITAADLRLSWPRLMEKYPEAKPPAGYKIRGTSGNKKKPTVNSSIRLTGPEYLYIGAAEVQGGFSAENLTMLSDAALVERINERIEEAALNPDGSADLYCVFQVYYGSRNDCEEIGKFYYSRGYNMTTDHIKTIKERYNKLTISNRFSQREFHEMVYTCITQMKNEDVGGFISKMKAYCRDNRFPFMRDIK